MDWHFGATAFATALTIIDPIGMIPITLASTGRFDAARRSRVIDQAIAVAAIVMLFMGLVGPALLAYLGITLPAFTIAGGILLMLIAIDMLFARPSGARRTEQEERDAQAGEKSGGLSARHTDDSRPRHDRDRHAAGEPGARRRLQVLDGVCSLRRGAADHVGLHARGRAIFASHRNDRHPRRVAAARHHLGGAFGSVS